MTPRRLSPLSTVASKILIALTGLSLVGFLCLHLAGNLLLYAGPATFNSYAHALISNPLVIPAELGLVAIFVLHLLEASLMWLADRGARPVAYKVTRYAGGASRKTVASSVMFWTGLTTLVFLVIHVGTMKFGAWYTTTIDGESVRDLSRLVVEVFQRPGWVAFYAVCMIVLGCHLWHGFSSAFESLGLNHPRFTPRVLKAGKVLAVLLGAGFLSLPVWIFFFGGRS